jgi:YspA, cpYpsA-related SLOG family
MTEPYRVLVTGSREWTDAGHLRSELDALAREHPEGLTVVHGDAKQGADRMASDWARRERNAGRRVAEEAHPANWQRHGGHSGLLRNAEMVALGADLCLAWIVPCSKPYCKRPQPHGSHGASDCAERAVKAGIPVRRFPALTYLT